MLHDNKSFILFFAMHPFVNKISKSIAWSSNYPDITPQDIHSTYRHHLQSPPPPPSPHTSWTCTTNRAAVHHHKNLTHPLTLDFKKLCVKSLILLVNRIRMEISNLDCRFQNNSRALSSRNRNDVSWWFVGTIR